jgi:Ni/Fe-hydrogenase subunit HybB-like protein
MAPPKVVEARFGATHNISMALVAVAMVAIAIGHFMANPDKAPTLSFNDPRFVLFAALAIAMLTYTFLGIRRAMNRAPQVVIDRDGIAVGFGRNTRFKWSDIQCAVSPSAPNCRSAWCRKRSSRPI